MKKIAFIILAGLLSAAGAFAQDAARKTNYNLEKGLAMEGYDAVAYFKQNKAVKGKKELAVVDRGVTYYFSTSDYKQEFIRNAAAYEPQYGGWCAYAMGSTGEKVEVDPETFKIVNGKLYLFYHSWVNNTLNKWNKDETGLKARADKNWQVIFH